MNIQRLVVENCSVKNMVLYGKISFNLLALSNICQYFWKGIKSGVVTPDKTPENSKLRIWITN